MFDLPRGLFPRFVLIALAVVALAMTGTPAFAARPTPTESYARLQQQIARSEVTIATFNRKNHEVRITLKDGTHGLVSYPSHQYAQLSALLSSHGASIRVAKKKKTAKKAAGHHLRYIAAGIVVAGIIGLAILLLLRRRRYGQMMAAGGAPGAGAPPASAAAPGAGAPPAAEPDADEASDPSPAAAAPGVGAQREPAGGGHASAAD